MNICKTCNHKSTCALYSLPEVQQRLACPRLNLEQPHKTEVISKGHPGHRYKLLQFLKRHLN